MILGLAFSNIYFEWRNKKFLLKSNMKNANLQFTKTNKISNILDNSWKPINQKI
jgi:hypothetical protein